MYGKYIYGDWCTGDIWALAYSEDGNHINEDLLRSDINITSFGVDHEIYIDSLRKNIKQVHIKDRIVNPLETVEPTTGDTDFKLIFNCLKQINYDGLYTLQTARGTIGDEVRTIKKHKKIIEGIYND